MGDEIKVFYRISDKGREKSKLPRATKKGCLENAIQEFGKDNIYVFADNCSTETVNYLREENIRYEETSLGNSGSFLYMCRYIIENIAEQTKIYLLEDDYIHRNNSKQVMLEGLECADYVTLYDHPECYWIFNDGKGHSPYNRKQLQPTTVTVTKSTHWRECNSTTMTFATTVKTLKDDFKIWEKYVEGRKIPNDLGVWSELTQNSFRSFRCLFQARFKLFFVVGRNFLLHKKMRKLISPIPGYASHAETDCLSPVIEWNSLEKE